MVYILPPNLMALLPSITALGLTKMSSSPLTLQLVTVAPYLQMLMTWNNNNWKRISLGRFLIVSLLIISPPHSPRLGIATFQFHKLHLKLSIKFNRSESE